MTKGVAVAGGGPVQVEMVQTKGLAHAVAWQRRVGWAAIALALAWLVLNAVLLRLLVTAHAAPPVGNEHWWELERSLEGWSNVAAIVDIAMLLTGYTWVRCAERLAQRLDPSARPSGDFTSLLGWIVPVVSWFYGPWVMWRVLRATGVGRRLRWVLWPVWAYGWVRVMEVQIGARSSGGHQSLGVFEDVLAFRDGLTTFEGTPGEWTAHYAAVVGTTCLWAAIIVAVGAAQRRRLAQPDDAGRHTP
ncbi:hypothetical protein [Arsenicicoccus dermatophilus]|uniref:hypothetical protein n=1 Tax=Arsenicicoccus dermatophilus TaxID=1076331 RepID=UPI001F4CC686|nr:hypothetical protein [Arsenicicoccus dermatophilus]MCH8613505.1 hypothetical protein [Arsenicicoccus dermatophilus]